MESQAQVGKKGLDRYPMSYVIVGNILMFLWLIVGSAAIWLAFPNTAWIAWIFLAVSLLLVYVVLRKLVCTNCCYYGEWCSMGWGKLAAALFKKGDVEKFGSGIGPKLAPFVYGLLTLIPMIVILASIVLVFDNLKLGLFIVLILFAIYSGWLSRKAACSRCKMQDVCPGNATKKKTAQ
jgi:hypothetical protein